MARRRKTDKERTIGKIKHHLDCISNLKKSLRQEDLTGLGTRRERERPLQNVGPITERTFRAKAAANGWRVSKRGWPDFILRKGARVVFVEVKTYADTALKDEQQQIAELLVAAGFEVFRWDPERGFRPIKGMKGAPFLTLNPATEAHNEPKI
jgi:hypothetical protein